MVAKWSASSVRTGSGNGSSALASTIGRGELHECHTLQEGPHLVAMGALQAARVDAGPDFSYCRR